MRGDMVFLANPYFAGLQLAPPEPLSPSLPGFNVQPRVAPPRALGPVAPAVEDDGFRRLAPADARMFLGRDYDPASNYWRNRLTGEIESMDGLPVANDAREIARRRAQQEGAPSSQQSPYDFRNLFNR